MQLTDQEIIEKYLEGETDALDLLVDRYMSIIYRFIYRQMGNADDANDITQDVFVKAWKNLKKYNPNQNFKTWIMTIARNSSIDYLRKRKSINFSKLNNDFSDEEFEDTLVDSEPLPDEVYERGEAKGVVEELMKVLTETQRSAINLRINEDLSFEEIAEVLGRPLNTVKSDFRRGLIAMRKSLESDPKNASNINN